MKNEIKVGDKYIGKVNKKEFEITNIDEINEIIYYRCDGQIYHYGLKQFKKCLLEKK